MAAEITLFPPVADGILRSIPVAGNPLASYTATFTPTATGVIRVFANGSVVTLTINSKTFTIPDGGIEYFGVLAGVEVTVA